MLIEWGDIMALKVINVDDEVIGIKSFEKIIVDIDDAEYLGGFDNPYKAIEFVKNNPIDVAFLDIEMPEMNGIELAKELKNIDINIQIVFVTGYDQYALNAFDVDAIGYLLKPYKKESVQKNIDKTKRITKIGNKRIKIQTFGHFNVFIDNKPVMFSLAKCKELLAVLVDRLGEPVSMEYVIDCLWEDRVYDSRVKALYRQVLSQLNRTFLTYNLKDVLVINRANVSLNIESIECDYFNMVKKKSKQAIKDYKGEYLFDYGWAETTVVKLDEIKYEYDENYL
jgi:two-component SAPR family response regulator